MRVINILRFSSRLLRQRTTTTTLSGIRKTAGWQVSTQYIHIGRVFDIWIMFDDYPESLQKYINALENDPRESSFQVPIARCMCCCNVCRGTFQLSRMYRNETDYFLGKI